MVAFIVVIVVVLIGWPLLKSSIQESNAEQIENQIDTEGINTGMGLIHLEGLNLGKGTAVYFSAIKDIVTIECGKIEYTIDMEQIEYTIDMEQINNVSMQSISSTVSDGRFSISNAMLGSILLINKILINLK